MALSRRASSTAPLKRAELKEEYLKPIGNVYGTFYIPLALFRNENIYVLRFKFLVIKPMADMKLLDKTVSVQCHTSPSACNSMLIHDYQQKKDGQCRFSNNIKYWESKLVLHRLIY